MSFEGKVVLITGASSGIGAATAVEFAKNGASVAIVGRNVEKLNKAAESCSKYSKPLIIKADVADDDECKKIVASVIKAFGKLDVLVNNAGMMRNASISDGNFLEMYDETMKVNVRAHLNVTSLAVPYLIKTKAIELAGEGVRVNTVSPGPVITDFMDNAGIKDIKIDNFGDSMPLKRVSQSVEIADMILFLASDKAVGVTGAEFVVDNGYLIKN